jgi:FAD:protein FMN transferase
MSFNHVRLDQNHMATTFQFRISCESEKAALADRTLTHAHALVTRLENELTEFKEQSPVYQLNHLPQSTPIKMAASTLDLLEKSEALRQLTAGSFSPYAKSKTHSSTPFSWNKATQTALKNHDGAWLGFGAIGKGYALDQVRLLVESQGFHDYVLSAGDSSLIISGQAGPYEPWKWGWSWKKDQDGEALGIPFAHHIGSAVAIGVSGLHEKGKHIIDPNSGGTAASHKSALVACDSAAEADALSTAFFVSGWEKGMAFVKNMVRTPAVALMPEDETPVWNGFFEKLWGPVAAALATISFWTAQAGADEGIDLSSLGGNDFTPYVIDRSPYWILLPILSIALVLLHLKKLRRNTVKPKIGTHFVIFITSLLFWASVEVQAVEFEPMGKAIEKLLGTSKAFTKELKHKQKNVKFFYSKNGGGKAEKVVFVENGLYPPNCTHTWAIGLDAKSGTVLGVRPIEMSCPHAFPTKEEGFLDKYKGKTPADAAKLRNQITVIAKATGSSNLMSDAVARSLQTFTSQVKGKF